MKGIMEDFLIFVVGIFIILIIIATVFGKGIAYNYLGILAQTQPGYLQEDLRTYLTVAAYSQGDYEAKIKINSKNEITIYDVPYLTINVTAPPEFNLGSVQSVSFLAGDCVFLKKCEKFCGLIGDACSKQEECCAGLTCKYGISCNITSTLCGNGVLDLGEECDPGKPGKPANDSACPTQCTSICTCPKGYKQCADGKDNDGDGKVDAADPDCHTDFNSTNSNSYVLERYETRKLGESCMIDMDCGNLLKCMSKVDIGDKGGTLYINKFFENGMCEIMISKGTE